MPKEILKVIADNPTLLQALREVFEEQFTEDRPALLMTDEQLGQIARARLTGLEKVNKALKEIERYRTAVQKEENKNPAR